MTGQSEWVQDYQNVAVGGRDLWNINPKTGTKQINLGAINSLLGGFGMSGGGGGGYTPQSYTPTDFNPSQITPPSAYGGFDYDTIGSGIDPSAVIAAQEYRLQEAMEGDMANAGARAGKSGFAMSTPYMDSLGAAARKASQDRNAITMQYQYDAAQQQAQRDLQQQLQAAQIDFGAWNQQGNWGMQGQTTNAEMAFQKWLAENNIGMQNTQMQNEASWNNYQQQYGSQQDMLASILGGLF
jgi:hypothetical protein